MKLHIYPVFFRSQDCGRLFKEKKVLQAFDQGAANVMLALMVEDGLAHPNSFTAGCECEVDYATRPAYWVVPS